MISLTIRGNLVNPINEFYDGQYFSSEWLSLLERLCKAYIPLIVWGLEKLEVIIERHRDKSVRSRASIRHPVHVDQSSQEEISTHVHDKDTKIASAKSELEEHS